MAGVSIEIDQKKFNTFLNRMQKRSRTMTPAWKIASAIMRESVVENFNAGGRPKKWEESARASKQGGKTLVDTGNLRNSINASSGNNFAKASTNVKYAAIHNFGGTIPAHTIKPKHKFVLRWAIASAITKRGKPSRSKAKQKGTFAFAKFVNIPEIKMPKREFMVLQDPEDFNNIEDALVSYIVEGKRQKVKRASRKKK